ncbi:hypothetical protein BDW68DRAFT_187869 [Aspergillus falconensis]
MQMSADSLNEYCFYSIYTTLSEYTFEGSVITSQDRGGSLHGSSGTSSESGDGSSDSGQSSSSSTSGHASSDTDTSSTSSEHGSADSSTSHSTAASAAAAMVVGGALTGLCNSTIEQSLCDQNNLTLMDLSEIGRNVTDAYIAALPRIDPEMNDTTTTGTIGEVVLLSENYYRRAYKSYVYKRFGWGIIGYWGGILVLGMLAKFISSVSTQRRGHTSTSTSSSRDTESSSNRRVKPSRRLHSAPLHYVKTYIALPASFAPFLANHQQLFWYHTTSRLLDLLISFEGNIEMTSLFQQNWQSSSDRTGILSYACLPFLWLFGGSNNIFLWATDFNTQSFNIFNRHVAWACKLLAIAHSVNYSVVFAYHVSGKQEYWYMGVVATILMSFMLVLSMTILRHKGYETFLILHVIFAIVVVYALFRHTSFDGTKWNGYLWQMVAIWAFDRTVRLLRIAYCNLNVRFRTQFNRTTSSVVQCFEDSDLIKVELSPASSKLKPAPGQHYYFYQPATLKGWENHPFHPWRLRSELIFYIRPYDGWTRRLRDQCRKSGLHVINPKLLLEGPYRHAAPLHTFDTVLMVVGGMGIAAAVPYIIDHVSRSGGTTKTRTTRLRLVWSARTKEMFERVFCNELAGILGHEDILTSFYCTSSRSWSSSSSSELSSSKKEKRVDVAVLPTSEKNPVEFLSGRPNVGAIVTAEAQEAKANSSRLAVLTCVPAQMADECRQTVYEVMRG